jgi:hypothetical protein
VTLKAEVFSKTGFSVTTIGTKRPILLSYHAVDVSMPYAMALTDVALE